MIDKLSVKEYEDLCKLPVLRIVMILSIDVHMLILEA